MRHNITPPHSICYREWQVIQVQEEAIVNLCLDGGAAAQEVFQGHCFDLPITIYLWFNHLYVETTSFLPKL